MKYVCDVCGYIYDEDLGDPDNGIAAGTKFDKLPDDWVCPLCGVGTDQFQKLKNSFLFFFFTTIDKYVILSS